MKGDRIWGLLARKGTRRNIVELNHQTYGQMDFSEHPKAPRSVVSKPSVSDTPTHHHEDSVNHPERAPIPVSVRLPTAQTDEKTLPPLRPCVVEVGERRRLASLSSRASLPRKVGRAISPQVNVLRVGAGSPTKIVSSSECKIPVWFVLHKRRLGARRATHSK